MSIEMKPEAGFNGVSAGGTATIDLPVSGTYLDLDLIYGTSKAGGPTLATMKSDIKEIRVKLNGKVQRRYSAEELLMLNATYGMPAEDGVLSIYFAEPWRKTVEGIMALAWGMGGVSSFQLEVDIDDGALAPTLSIESSKREFTLPIKGIKKVMKHNLPISAVGLAVWTGAPKNDAYCAMHCQSEDIDTMKIKRDSKIDHNVTRAALARVMLKNGLVPQGGWTQNIFDVTRQVGDFLPMTIGGANGGQQVTNFLTEFDMSEVGGFTILTETIGHPD